MSMKSMKENIDKHLKQRKNPTSARAYLIQQICDQMFSDKEFKKILFQTGKFTVREIREIYDQARSWQVNPPALFWKLVRQKQVEIKKQIEEASKDL